MSLPNIPSPVVVHDSRVPAETQQLCGKADIVLAQPPRLVGIQLSFCGPAMFSVNAGRLVSWFSGVPTNREHSEEGYARGC